MSILQAIILAFMHGRTDVTGYDISVAFDGLWSHQQVYRELGKLKVANLVREKVIPQDGKPDRRACTPNAGAKTTLVNFLMSEQRRISVDLATKDRIIVVADLMHKQGIIDKQEFIEFLDAYAEHYARVVDRTKDCVNMHGYRTHKIALAEFNLATEYSQNLV